MATLREYFDGNKNGFSFSKNWTMTDPSSGKTYTVIAQKTYDLVSNSSFMSFFIENGTNYKAIIYSLMHNQNVENCMLTDEGDGIYFETSFSDYTDKATSETVVFTRRIYLYVDEMLGEELRTHTRFLGEQRGFDVVIRDTEYAIKVSALQKPLAFISHDSRDKDVLVRQLALELTKQMCPVWYDEYSLKVGDSLRANIEAGLKETKKCIVVLSPNFISNEGWGKAEFDSVYTREIIEKNNVILPIWHDVAVEDVYNFSPRMADKVGLNSNIGIEQLAKKLASIIKG